MAVAVVEQAPPKKTGPSLVIQIAVLLVMTLVAVGGGWFSGGYLNSGSNGSASAEGEPAEAAGGHGEAPKVDDGHGKPAADALGGKEAAPGQGTIIDLPPMTTNLAAPSEVWVRLEATMVLDVPSQDPTLPNLVHQDLLAFLRTVKMHQVEGASGFQHLKADLEERASIRSDGHVKSLLIRTLLFE